MFLMPLDALLAGACLLAFLGLMLFAAASDVATMTIPNWVSIAAAALFPVAGWLAGLTPAAIGFHLAVGAAAFVVGFFLFSFGVLGGGDVKVIAAASVWTGLAAMSAFAIAMTLTGGLLAGAILLARRAATPAPTRAPFLNRLLDPANGIPYAVAIAIGVAAAAPALPVTRALTGH
jgi:prepilin peptidase CpaA